jgi:hypothetical protein
LSCLVLSCLVLSGLVLSCRVVSSLVVSCLVVSCLVASCLILYAEEANAGTTTCWVSTEAININVKIPGLSYLSISPSSNPLMISLAECA